jgi:hypothetical protein
MTQALPGRGPQHARVLGWLVVLALVVAQTGALLHQYSHLRPSGDATIPGQTCVDCLASAPLLAAAGVSPGLPVVLRTEISTRVCDPEAPLLWRHSQTAFLARAPPSIG